MFGCCSVHLQHCPHQSQPFSDLQTIPPSNHNRSVVSRRKPVPNHSYCVTCREKPLPNHSRSVCRLQKKTNAQSQLLCHLQRETAVQSQPFCHLQEAIIGKTLLSAVGSGGGGGAVVPHFDAVGVRHGGGQGVGGHAGLGQIGPARHAVQLLLLLRLVLIPSQHTHTHSSHNHKP